MKSKFNAAINPTKIRRGYKSRATDPELRVVLDNVKALQELSDELLQKINHLPSGTVTPTEFVRDFGASSSGRKLFSQAGWLVAAGSRGKRKTYEVREIVRAAVLLPGFFLAPRTRIQRK